MTERAEVSGKPGGGGGTFKVSLAATFTFDPGTTEAKSLIRDERCGALRLKL